MSDTVETSRDAFLAAERRMLATLDSAAMALPSDEMLVGTFVFMLTRRGLHTDAELVASPLRCTLPAPNCQLLRGYVHQASGNTMHAAAAFDSAMARLAEAERCSLLNSWAVLDEADRVSYVGRSCAERAAQDATFWWLSDPSYLVPGNDRLTEQLARAVGNQVLARYRAVRSSIGGIFWYSGAIPRADSAERYFDYAKWTQHPPGPWRWYDELTRFGMPDAIDIISGSRRVATYVHRTPSGGTIQGAPITGCFYVGQGCLPSSAVVCRTGYEPRELHLQPRELPIQAWPDIRAVPPYGSAHSGLYPAGTFPRYDWSDPGGASCARLYNTKARYEFTPLWRETADPFDMTAESWQLDNGDEFAGGPPHREQYTPPYAPVTTIDQFQIARLPRGDSMLVLAVMHTSGNGLDPARNRGTGGKWESALIATSKVPPQSPRDIIVVRSQSETFTPRQVLTSMMPTASIFTALEILTPDTVGFARTRTGIPISPWLQGSAKLSDIVLFRPDTSSPDGAGITTSSLDSIMPLALPSLSVAQGEELGLYWETQVPGLAATMTEANVSLTIERIDREEGFFGRLFGGIFGGRDAGVRGVAWKTPIPSARSANGVRWGNAVRIPTNTLDPGEYVLAIEVSGISASAPVTTRSLTIVRPPR